MAFAQALAGQPARARETLKRLTTLRERGSRYVSAHAIALIYTGLGERDQAIAWLQRARDERAFGMAFVHVEPDFDSLRSDPRFATIGR